MRSTPEFSRPLTIIGLDADGTPFNLCANETERAALACRFGLHAIDAMTCDGVAVSEEDGRRIRVTGRVTADVVQLCSVTLEPLPARLDVDVVRVFAVDARDEWSLDAVDNGEIIVTGDDEDAPEPIHGETIDLGEMAAEILALELDPFPRAPGAVFSGFSQGSAESADNPGANGPFAALATLQTAKRSRSDRRR